MSYWFKKKKNESEQIIDLPFTEPFHIPSPVWDFNNDDLTTNI